MSFTLATARDTVLHGGTGEFVEMKNVEEPGLTGNMLGCRFRFCVFRLIII